MYALCAVNGEGKTTTLVSYYSHDEGKADKTINFDFGESKRGAKYEIYLLDEACDGEKVGETSDATVTRLNRTFA